MKNERSTEYYMAEVLYDESRGPLAGQRFTDWELRFIANIWSEFFNNPEFELTENQFKVLHKLWER